MGVVENAFTVGLLLFLTNLAQASPDVMIDASIAERSKTHPLFAADLQTLCWSSYFFFTMIAYQAGGYLEESYGHRVLFFSLIFTCLLVLYPSVKNWLGDKPGSSTAPLPSTPSSPDHGEDEATGFEGHSMPQRQTLLESFRDPVKGPVFRLALFITFVSLGQGFAANAVEDKYVPIFGGLTIVAVCGAVYFWLGQISRLLMKAVIMIFFYGALQPSTNVISVWSKATNDPTDLACGSPDAPEGSEELRFYQDKWCHACAEGKDFLEGGFPRPCFDAPFLALTAVVGSCFGLLGTAVYNKYFGQWPYRKIWTLTQLFFVGLSFLDLIWVNRLNMKLGISDKAFVLGQEVFVPVIMRLAAMPLFVLAAQLCPANVEATLFALIMGISNMSWVTGNYLGVGIVAALNIYEPQFENMVSLIYIRSACSLLPLVTIQLLCPKGTPSDTMNTMEAANSSKTRADGERTGEIEMEDF
uniref:Folate-biopterin transporter n=1 Tax=Pyramimonas obovata TaxID=1411642 RepID=A0A7S0RVZ0_9CHLO